MERPDILHQSPQRRINLQKNQNYGQHLFKPRQQFLRVGNKVDGQIKNIRFECTWCRIDEQQENDKSSIGQAEPADTIITAQGPNIRETDTKDPNLSPVDVM